MKLWADVPVEQRPAMYMCQKPDAYKRTDRVPAIVTLSVDLFIYTYTPPGDDYVPSTAMNNILDAVDALLKPNAWEQEQTLGGLVTHCWIEGEIVISPRDLDNDGLAVVPIKILATD